LTMWELGGRERERNRKVGSGGRERKWGEELDGKSSDRMRQREKK